jgi:hypothetical protein
MKHRKLYRLSGKLLELGIYCKESDGFFGIRNKLGFKYLTIEHRMDTEKMLGSAFVMEELSEELPENISLKDGWTVCRGCKKELYYVRGVEGESLKGGWIHEEGDCQAKEPEHHENVKLFEWLRSVCEKYNVSAL